MAFLTRAAYKTWAGITDTSKDAQIDQLLPAVVTAIRDETDRDFEADEVAEAREYLYDGSGVLEIDDAKLITEVKVVQSGILIPDTVYQAETQTGKITWLELPEQAERPGVSPEMGFANNLDQLWWRATPEPKIRVTATFGWADADVPAPVLLAGLWAINDWLSVNEAASSDLTAESIAGYSRAWSRFDSTSQVEGLPRKSRDLLAPYRRN